MDISDIKLINFDTKIDERGKLSIVQGMIDIPFDIKRIYYLYDIPIDSSRGSHGHKELQQVFIALSGSVKIKISDGHKEKIFLLEDPSKGLYVPKMMWRELEDFSKDAICMVLASAVFDSEDYIYNYDEFLKFKKIDD